MCCDSCGWKIGPRKPQYTGLANRFIRKRLLWNLIWSQIWNARRQLSKPADLDLHIWHLELRFCVLRLLCDMFPLPRMLCKQSLQARQLSAWQQVRLHIMRQVNTSTQVKTIHKHNLAICAEPTARGCSWPRVSLLTFKARRRCMTGRSRGFGDHWDYFFDND